MALTDKLATDARNVFCAAGGFTETVTYNPIGGTPRQIIAQVYRLPAQRPVRGQRITAPHLTIVVQNDPVLGISTQTMNAADTVMAALREGDDPVPHPIILPPKNSDASMVTLELA